MTKKLVYSSQAKADLEEIFFFIAADNPTRAGSYVASRAGNAAIGQIDHHPARFPLITRRHRPLPGLEHRAAGDCLWIVRNY